MTRPMGHAENGRAVAGVANRATIGTLNDEFRRTLIGGQMMITARIAALPDTTRAKIIEAVRTYSTFGSDHDLYGEHAFGAITVEGARVYWKIDYYDLALQNYSPEPADPFVTRRVMTIMFAEEY